jgi:hypothetical protein
MVAGTGFANPRRERYFAENQVNLLTQPGLGGEIRPYPQFAQRLRILEY